MKIQTLIDLDAAHDIDDGLKYLQSDSGALIPDAVRGFGELVLSGLSTGVVLANFPASQGSRLKKC